MGTRPQSRRNVPDTVRTFFGAPPWTRDLARGEQQFVEEVLPAELEAIAARREVAGVESASRVGDGAPGPSVARDLVGLCLSGGGIRSAAFNLGVLQAMHRYGLLRHVDYLSTVSGGGWIGSALQTLLREPGAPFPFEGAEAGAGHEAPAVSHLRDRSAALLPSGMFGRVVIAAALLRGQIATAALLVPVTLMVAFATVPALFAYIRVRSPEVAQIAAKSASGASLGEQWLALPWTWFTSVSRWVVAGSAAGLFLGFFLATLTRRGPKARRRIERAGGWSLIVATAAVFLELQPWVALQLSEWLYVEKMSTLRGSTLTTAFGALACLLTLGPLAVALPRVARPVAIAVAGVVSVALPYLALLALEILLVHLELSHRSVLDVPTVAAFFVLTVALLLLGDVNVLSLHAFYRDRLTRTFLLRRADAGVTLDEEVPLSALNRPGTTAPYCLVNTALNLQASDDRSLHGRNADLFVFSPRFVGSARTGYCRTEIMEYATPGLDLGTAMAISAAAAAPNMGTYTIRAVVMLMTFLNLRLGYWLPHPERLTAWHDARGDIDLASHGAARRWAWFLWAPRLPHFVRELFSRLREDGTHVFLTDGGHLENTGAFELLRRRCRIVIACDAEEDPRLRFGGLAALMRYARIDLGIEIDLDLSELRLRASGLSHRHAALGTIRYPAAFGRPAETGVLVYIKSSLTGDEDELVHEYHARHPDFPHQSTSDQLYDEDQFEAYRALGQHAVEGLFSEGERIDARSASMHAWTERLEARLTPDASCDPAYSELRDEVEEVEDLLRQGDCEAYFHELYPELARDRRAADPSPDRVAMVVARQVHVLATAFNRLGLDVAGAWRVPRHIGWMNLFRRWAASPTFRRHWLVTVHQEGDAFRLFCEEALGLRITVSWEPSTREAQAEAGVATLDDAGDGATRWVGRLTLERMQSEPVFSAATRDGRVTAWGVRAGYAGALEKRARESLMQALRDQA